MKQSDRHRRVLTAGAIGGAHLALIAAILLWPQAAPPPQARPVPSDLVVSLDPQPPGPPDMTDPGGVPDIAPLPVPQVAAPTFSVAAVATPAPDTSDLLSSAQLAGAVSAGEGGAGSGGCDLSRAVQLALRRDARVRAAVTEAGRVGTASLLWNGDWVRSGGQEGKGLAVVRQAVVWEVGFAPQACRNVPMHGLLLLSLADGRTRFAIGARDWRWSDLLGLREVHR